MPDWTEEMIEFAKANRTLPRKELAREMSERFRPISVCAVSSYMKSHGWMTGRCCKYKPGNIPHPNAGPKGPNKTSFKIGNKAQNRRPIGSTRICAKDGYQLIKVSEPSTWRFTHVVMWEKRNGKVPSGHVLIFVDGDRTNLCLDNLICVHRGVLSGLNKTGALINARGELRESIIRTQMVLHAAKKVSSGSAA